MIERIDDMESYDMPDKHYHDHFEIYFQLSGERHYFIRDRVYNVQQGNIILINSGELHKTTGAGTKNFSRILLGFRKEFLDGIIAAADDIDLFLGFTRNICLIPLTLNNQEHIKQILFAMLKENQARTYGYSARIKANMLELLIFISRYAKDYKADDMLFYNVLHKKISQILQYINNSYANKLTLSDITASFDISSYYFCRVFKTITGFTFIEYVNAVRIKQAQELLAKTDLSIIEIAQKVGFESSTHFGRVFLKIVNVSPSKYRKNYTEQ